MELLGRALKRFILTPNSSDNLPCIPSDLFTTQRSKAGLIAVQIPSITGLSEEAIQNFPNIVELRKQ
jgi:hypothetical protein